MNFPNLPPKYSDWVIVDRIGKGSFGAVYKIKRADEEFTEYAALKVLTIPQGDELDALRSTYNDESVRLHLKDNLTKIKKEYAMMAKMKGCVNVVHCEDIQSVPREDGFSWDIFIKMELLTAWKEWVPAQYSEQLAIRMANDICNALKWCERFNVIHRDIKPENIFVSEDGSFKLGDFGIAKNMEGTSNATITGTYAYMAPEVYKSQAYNARADIYSLGMALYWLMNERAGPFLKIGKIPGTEEKWNSWMRRFSGEPLPPPKNGSEELKQIVLKACAFDPQDRYQTAAEMQDALNSIGKKTAFVPVPIPEFDSEKTDMPAVDDLADSLANEDLTVGLADEDITVSLLDEDATVSLVDEDATVSLVNEEATVSLANEQKTAGSAKNKTRKPEGKGKQKKKKKSKAGWVIVLLLLLIAGAVAYFMLGDPHLFCDWADATCSEPQTCRVCGKTRGEPLAHVWGEAACEKPITCVSCGFASGILQDHEWSEPTCQTPATCVRCNKESEEYAEHQWSIATCAVAASCTVCGESSDQYGEHVWADATCTKAPTCTVCGLEQGETLDHSWTNATCTKPATCTVCGLEQGETLEHNWTEATCIAPQTCMDCNATIGTTADHTWDVASCTAPATCIHCGAQSEAYGEHTWQEATCTEPQTCSVCGETNGSANGHTWGTDPDTGLKVCDVCGVNKLYCTLNYGEKDLKLGEYIVLKLTDPDGNEVDVQWTSDNACVSVLGNRITAVSLGTARITAEYEGETYACIVSVQMERTVVKNTISAGGDFTIAIKNDGTVVITETNGAPKYDVSGWRNIVSVCASESFVVGLQENGKVVLAGSLNDELKKALNWNNIIAIAAGKTHIVGVKKDGTVVAVGSSQYGKVTDVGGWTDIVAVAAGYYHTIGLKADGTVVTTAAPAAPNNKNQCNTSSWSNIVAIAAGNLYTVGLRADGTAVAVGFNGAGQCDVSGWRNVVAISAFNACTMGLKRDGTVVIAGGVSDSQRAVGEWTDVVAVSVGMLHTVALKADGTMVATGGKKQSGVFKDSDGCNVGSWKDIQLPPKPWWG